MDLDNFLGASMVIGLTFVEADGAERREAYIGHVVEIRSVGCEFENIEDNSGSAELVIECHDGETRTFPFSPEAIDPADPGFYELNDGATIENPDYEMLWRITAPLKN